MTEQELKTALAELAEVRSDAEPIVSLYLDAHWSDERQRDRARLYVRDAVRLAVDRHGAHPQLEALRRTLGRVAAEAGQHTEQVGEASHQGLAIFACESLGVWRVLSAPRPFKPELCVDGRPHLLQLARLAGDARPAVIAFVQDDGAQVYEVSLGTILSEAAVQRPVARDSDAARGRKSRRHGEELIDRVRREAIEAVRQVWERAPQTQLVLVGTKQRTSAFERALPERMRAKVLARLPRPPGKASRKGNGKAELLGRVMEKVIAHERAAAPGQVKDVIAEAMRGGLAVLGSEDVVLAVNERRVHRLILEEDFEASGWRCRNCDALGTTHDERCSFCQGPLARVDSLGEELVGRTLAEEGELEVVPHDHRLHAYRGVAALLRQAHASRLPG